MDEDQIRGLLRTKLEASGKTKIQFAHEDIGVSETFLYDVLAGKRKPGNKVRKYLGITKTTIYTKQK
jgi:hypothetical protein